MRAGQKAGKSGTDSSPSGNARTVGEIGEFELIDRLVRILGAAAPEAPLGPGDDAALLKTRGTDSLITTDVLEEDVHFRRSWFLPRELGEKALEINLSDIAAMGGIPTVGLISLVLPPNLPLEVIEDVYRGIRRSAIRSGVRIAGGNLTATLSGRLAIHVTQLGYPAGKRVVRREGGSPGDLLVVTGFPGLASLGRRLIERFAGPESLWRPGLKTPGWREEPHLRTSAAHAALGRFLKPRARVEAGTWAAGNGATAMIDLSDGLAGDVRHLAAAGGIGMELDLERLPRPTRVDELCDLVGSGWSDLALSGGEDYELLFSIPEARWTRAPKPRNVRFSVIGKLMPGRHGLTVRDSNGVRPLFEEGFSHFG